MDKAKKKKHLKKRKKDSPENYARVGIIYFKIIWVSNRFESIVRNFVRWSRQELLVDFSDNKHLLKKIKIYDGFGMFPDNTKNGYVKSEYNLLNRYDSFLYEPKEGEWGYVRAFLMHIFGEQYNLGLRYFQTLYMYPKVILPVLVLVSKARETGKTTFLNFVMAIFGNNAVMLNNEMIGSSFNGSYAWKNIICIDEAGLNHNNLDEKIKLLSTAKTIEVNEKFVPHYSLPFYGKLIIASNKENSFLRIDSEEVRYFIRKLKKPKTHDSFFLDKMIGQIPAFIYHLSQMEEPDFNKSRQLFTVKELKNDSLKAVVEESKSYVYKELQESFIELFANNDISDSIVHATPTDIKQRFFINNHKIDRVQVKKALKDEFGFKKEGLSRYVPFGIRNMSSKTGRPWVIEKRIFMEE
ncbi:hypothetical protein FVB32_16105 [Flagellimonas hymeniacidonis]|uniref:NrS-1 polymerase-like helicase domain-containing protein n=1 Tax=Flagellimonas hymeniacidonis TaxID=2603628 RepID=A0A5C8V410_9FLAO|nr:primase-helicase family protein [Flagellimonas hymeniacidonis]TXN36081.1 hypothetical protein FVB32_16105 [Flagellimonas hymeniacidonis]